MKLKNSVLNPQKYLKTSPSKSNISNVSSLKYHNNSNSLLLSNSSSTNQNTTNTPSANILNSPTTKFSKILLKSVLNPQNLFSQQNDSLLNSNSTINKPYKSRNNSIALSTKISQKLLETFSGSTPSNNNIQTLNDFYLPSNDYEPYLNYYKNFHHKKNAHSGAPYNTQTNTNNNNCLTEENEDVYTVKKLSIWETENLDFKEENYNKLYNKLSRIYQKDNNISKIQYLKSIKDLLYSIGGINTQLEKLDNGIKNKAIDKFIDNKKKEENVLLLNSISKTTRKYGRRNGILLNNGNVFGIKLLNVKKESQSNIPPNERDTLIGNNNEFEGDVIYHRLINDKNRQETNMKNDLIDIGKKINIKKEEKDNIQKSIDDTYIKIRNLNEEYNKKKLIYDDEIMSIQEKVDRKKRFIMKINQNNVDNEDNYINELLAAKEIEKIKENLKINLKKNIQNIENTKIENMKKMKIVNEELNYLKNVYHLLVKEIRNYYYNILKSGYDVRYDGLIWVVKHLLEMNSILEYQHFPKFLSHEHIDYLIFMGKLSLEENLMNLILRTLKKKISEKRLKKNEIKIKSLNKLINNTNQNNKKTFNFNNKGNNIKNNHDLSNSSSQLSRSNSMENLSINKKNNKKIYITNNNNNLDTHTKLHFLFENIREKYKDAFKYCDDKRLDDYNLNKIITEIKKSIKNNGCYDNDENCKIIMKFFSDNIDNKLDFQMIFILREKIKENKLFRDRMKKDMINIMKQNEIEIKKCSNSHLSLRHELVCSALFGTNISI